MEDSEVLDTLFREAVSAIDAGDTAELERLLAAHPRLVRDRLEAPGAWLREQIGAALEGFFAKPYLLWFVAEDPVRRGSLPRNIAQLARAILRTAREERVPSFREQVDHALQLVCWSWIARQCGVQIELIDALIDSGASTVGAPDAALVNKNFAAAEHLLERGAEVTLPAALCLGRWEEVSRLAPSATAREKRMGMALAALLGKDEALVRLISFEVDPSAPSEDLYSHATPLHHAVSSASLDAVKVLVEAGAELGARDTCHDATPLGWADHCRAENPGNERGKRYAEIAAYLREHGAPL